MFFLKGASYAHPGYIKNTIKSMLLQNILRIKKNLVYFHTFFNVIIHVMAKAEYSVAITPEMILIC